MSRVVIITDQIEAVEVVRASFGHGGPEVKHLAVAGQSIDAVFGAVANAQPTVAIIGPEIESGAAVTLASTLDRQRPEIGKVLWAEPTAELLLQAIASGVRGVLPANPSLTELRDAVEQALLAAQRQSPSSPTAQAEPVHRGKVIAVTSPKGGTGKTTVATNLSVALAMDAPNKVVLVDLDLQFGDVEYALRLRPEQTMTDAVQCGEALDHTTVKSFLTAHPSGVFTLCAPTSPAEAESLDPAVVSQVVKLLADIFEYVIVDTASGIDDHTLNAIDLATDVVLLVATDVPTVRSAQKSLAIFRQLGHDDRPWHVVLNRADAKVGLGPEDVEEAIGVSADVRVPESRAIGAAMNHGSPVVESQPRSSPAKSLIAFARRFLPEAEAQGRRRLFDSSAKVG